MAYTKTNWVNNVTPINSINLNHIENGIKDNEISIDTITINKIQQDITTDGEPAKCGYKIDGKDAYCKMVSFTGGTGTDLLINHNITNFDKIWIDESNSFIYKNGDQSMSLNWFNTTTDFCRTWLSTQNTQIKMRCPANISAFTVYVYIKYTLNS